MEEKEPKTGGRRERTKKNSVEHKTSIKIAIGICGFMVGLFLLTSLYFRNHFYFGTKINSVDVSRKTPEDAEKTIKELVGSYSLELQYRGGEKENILGKDINLTYVPNGELQDLKKSQGTFGWISGIFKSKEYTVDQSLKYSEDNLKEQFKKLMANNEKDVVAPKEPVIKYQDNEYKIEDEVKGNTINKDNFYKVLKDSIEKGTKSIDLDKTEAYVNPKYTASSKEVLEAKDLLNKYIATNIIYEFNGEKETISKDDIIDWLSVDKDQNIVFNEKKMRVDLNKLFDSHESVGKERSFTTASGAHIRVPGGDYGWSVSTTKEIAAVIESIKKGGNIDREPTYAVKGNASLPNDIGDTYVEADLSKQHMWIHKNGQIVAEGDITSGNMKEKFDTPAGVYYIKYKEKDTKLKGQDYNVPVSYWMPFNGGVGIHDASWRKVFGGQIYKTNGSHGCLNSPLYLAKAAYENVKAGTPVVCYY